jgi:putative Mg2+ transporter-C (MgtC) family protein
MRSLTTQPTIDMLGLEFTEDFARIALEFGLKFVASILCGGVVGIERETSGKPAGLRTNILICLGSMLFTAMSFEMSRVFGGDATRIAAQIVTGIGFLGAGAILHETGKGITGMTTAAMIWLIAALGVMIGAGYIVSAIGLTILTTIAMLGLRRLERLINEKKGRDYAFTMPADGRTRDRLEGLVSIFDDALSNVTVTPDVGDRNLLTLRFSGSANERHEFMTQLYHIEGVRRRDVTMIDDRPG